MVTSSVTSGKAALIDVRKADRLKAPTSSGSAIKMSSSPVSEARYMPPGGAGGGEGGGGVGEGTDARVRMLGLCRLCSWGW